MNHQPNFLHELIIDSFAGGGGASTGIELALGRIVDIAINHDINAVKMHEANHPFTKHYCENIFEVDPLEATQGRQVGLLWASPDCTHFSRAKGGKPVKKEIRGLAWVVTKWAGAVRPRVIILENVPEFRTWGPIDEHGKIVVERKGETFNRFVHSLERLGYAVEWRVLDASDYGAGTSRKRLYLVARCDGQPIVFPPPTHGEGKGLLPKKVAADYIDFSVQGKSIFNRKKPLADNTLRRIAMGTDKFTIKSKKPFIIQSKFGNPPQDIDKPLSVITGVNDHTPLIAPHIQKYFGGEHQAGSAADAPLGTVTSIDHNALCCANLIQYHSETNGENARAYGVDEPIKTIDTNPRYALSTAHLVQYYSTGTALDIQKPMPTCTTKDRMAVVKTYLVKYTPGANLHNWSQIRKLLNKYAGYNIADDEILILEIDGVQYFIADITLRMLMPHELYGCQSFPADYIIDRTSDGKKMPIHEQVKKVGNSVCPVMAKALAAANCADMVSTRRDLRTMEEFYREVG